MARPRRLAPVRVRRVEGLTRRHAFGVAAYGVLPFGLTALARPVAVRATAADVAYPASLDGLASAARAAALDPQTPAWDLLAAVALCWSAALVAGALQSRFDVRPRRVALAVGVPPAALVAAATVAPIVDSWATAVVLLALALPPVAFPRELLRVQVWFDLVGYRGWAEPRDWYVELNRIVGIVFASFAFAALGGATLLI